MAECPYCKGSASLVDGAAVYPHRPDLAAKPFWACLPCGAWVGCHPGGTKPLGRLADAATRKAKMAAHAAFDPLWRSGRMTRREAYRWLAGQLGISFERCHIGHFSAEECAAVVEAVEQMGRAEAC